MSYIPNNKYKEIYQSSKDGNGKALEIIQALRKGASQEDLDGLMNSYYELQANIQPEPENAKLGEFEPQNEVLEEESPIETQEGEEIENVALENNNAQNPVDIYSVLDQETDGLFDENEIAGIQFSDFLSNKSKNAARSKKNADYFKSFDPQDRANYMNSKISNYKNKFNGNLSDIERKYNDMAMSLDAYSKNVSLMLDDNIDLDMSKTASCYDDLINDKDTMRSFGRYWDENDNSIINNKLANLSGTYGKQNVLAALNTLKSDNDAYRDFSNNQIDQEISRYSKSVSDLLK